MLADVGRADQLLNRDARLRQSADTVTYILFTRLESPTSPHYRQQLTCQEILNTEDIEKGCLSENETRINNGHPPLMFRSGRFLALELLSIRIGGGEHVETNPI